MNLGKPQLLLRAIARKLGNGQKAGFYVKCIALLAGHQNSMNLKIINLLQISSADFCNEEFELKSKGGRLGKTVPDGAYKTMMERLQSDTKPSLMMLSYEPKSKRVRDLAVIPKQFFIPELIKKRKPLSDKAKRAGWVGCDIKIDRVPEFGKIRLITDRIARPKNEVVASWERTAGLRKKSFKQMGWVADVLRCVERIGQTEFTLDDVYKFENYLSELHPENNHVKPKIRQQLQVLRDAGVLEFVSRGKYRVR